MTQIAPTPLTDSSAQALISNTLGTYGLASLASWAWGKWQNGESIDQIMLELRQTPEYQQRFPAMASLAQQGHAITESQYINYETSAQQMFQAAGLPKGMYDTPDAIAKLLTSNVALPELQTRLQTYQTAAYQSPPEVRQALQDYYGITPGHLTAFFIDPDQALPLIQRDFAAAQAGGEANATGFAGGITQQQAESLANMGISPTEMTKGFSTLANLNQVIQGLPGQAQGVGTNTALQAQFGQNAQAQQQLEAAQQYQVNQFKEGGQVASNSKGEIGAGSA
jgi:hypothetical protein